MQITSIQQFAEACKNKSSDEIYDLFEHELSRELRDEIYDCSNDDTPEPARSAFNNIGQMFNIESLIEY